MATTIRDNSTTLAAHERCWHLTIVHHEVPGYVGRRAVLAAGAALTLGRDGEAFGPGVLAEAKLSRRHCVLELDARGALVVSDAGSSNGTFCNGARIERAVLAPRDVLRVGSTLLAVARVEGALEPRDYGDVPARSVAMARLLEALMRLGTDDACVLLRAELDTGVESVAHALARATGAAGAVVVRTEDLDDDPGATPVQAALASLEDALRARQTVLLGPLPFASDELERAFTAAIARARGGRVLLHWPDDPDDDTPPTVTERMRQKLAPLVLTVPPLRERLEDLPVLIAQLATRFHGRVPALHHRLALALLRARWDGNLLALARFVRALLAPDPSGAPLALRPEHSAALGAADDDDARNGGGAVRASAGGSGPGAMSVSGAGAAAGSEVTTGTTATAAMATMATATASAGPGATYRIALDGRVFELPDGTRVRLQNRYALARILQALVEQHRRAPGACCSIDALVQAGWPGARLVAGTGPNRVYVAVATLRKLGLRDVLVRDEDGYRLANGPRIELVPDAALAG